MTITQMRNKLRKLVILQFEIPNELGYIKQLKKARTVGEIGRVLMEASWDFESFLRVLNEASNGELEFLPDACEWDT